MGFFEQDDKRVLNDKQNFEDRAQKNSPFLNSKKGLLLFKLLVFSMRRSEIKRMVLFLFDKSHIIDQRKNWTRYD